MSFFLFLVLSSASHLYKEAYIYDTVGLVHRLQSNSLTSSVSEWSFAVETVTAWSKEEELEEEDEAEDQATVTGQENIFQDVAAYRVK